MQPLESGDEIVQMEEKVALPTLVWDSACDDSSDIAQVFPRIGDQYQVKIPPFDPSRICYWNEGKDSKVKDDDYEELFAEGLSVPIMQITISSPKISLAESEKDCRNEPSVESLVVTKELTKSEVKLEHGFEQDSFEERDERCIPENNFVDNMHITQDHVDSSMVYTNLEIPLTKREPDDVGIESADAVNNAPDALSSGKGRRRRKGKGSWKRVKKAKVELSKASKQKFEPSGHNDHREKNLNSGSFIMVPGSAPEPWTETEEDVFLLALYIFGKNFTSVQSFMETKKMKDILVYYYTKFYGTESYCRWAESRKIKSRKCFQGQRIFSGWRQQELSMRLLPHVPEHLKDKIPDAMKGFNEGRVTIEEFVNELKTLVGLITFVQAIGIGKGNHDLTAPLMDPMKTNQVVSARCEIPMGRACSSLSAEEIVKFLTGDYRLSKARSNDLFWEAVWPRLLARGWHSEQPDDQAFLGSKQSLVFLIPGVQKFSRRILVKGVHYFDSLSEVLSRVALEPRLLDPPKPEMGEMMGSKLKPECLWTAEILEEQSDRMRESPCYLQPRYHRSDIESYVFTIIDTSLASEGEDIGCVRQNRMLPTEDLSACLQYDSGETEDLNSELLLSMEAKVCKPSILDPLSTNPAESVPAITHNENSAELDDIFTASPSHSSALPSSQSEQNGNYSTGLILQTGPSAPISEEGTVYSSYSGRGRTWEPNEEGCSYPNIQDTCDVVSHDEVPFSCNNLSSISKQRRLNISSCGDCETTDSRLIGSSAATEHQLVTSGLEVKSETSKETPSSVVEIATLEKGKSIMTSTQPNDKKSDRDLSTLQSECLSSFSRTSNNALCSKVKLCRVKSQNSPDSTSPQDPSESVMLSTISGMETAHMGPTKSEDISLSEHDTGHSQEKATDLQQQSSSPTYEDAWKSPYSHLKQESRHYQEQLNDLQAAPGGSPFEECVNFQNSHPQKIPILSQEHPNEPGKTQSLSHIPGDGQPHEMLENNAQESQAEGRRQSTRNRPLTAKALEAYASGFYSARRRKGGKNNANTDSSHTTTISRKCIYDPSFLPNGSSLDNNSDITIVDTSMDSVDGEGNNDCQVERKARNGYKRRRTHAVMKVPKTGFYTENLEQDGKEDVVSGILVSEIVN
ncbi:hypothetical protein SUGI_0595940 [Cryptomeria japonica]|uniref:uncharacterized protein LOC131040437 n=1 Tax=Cryptomeria japonica TaxID=3369 RepID=UPI002414A4CD|nr:uncharacterized protein LOC131040437 [Cryptomeria japonica]XP_057829333.2 uncharacterized protein LOC131040437 [Cryptomeria japonica]XP_057829334.2 uncharacterized protein LOC131040437 [Cryptomeria japonica]XP_057829335.2 uncharacterized protein LOC131040437 [Cryptomeria japonica]XP_057829337.2 uncharacterized protein LOC131040437 [Cryptomeria japonica]XP_057829338.2 uncharacterized protein LOC131040437 [Cryptomeria japonica]XP_057829339.2 uncharacterized protein LOC131040437 [Cryptomeria 